MYYAHSENPQGKRHALADHLTSTASLARSFAPSKELEDLFYLAGLLHDVGKFQEAFQKYLRTKGESRRTPHAGIGAYIAKLLAKQQFHLQFVIQGHHAGLPNNEERRQNNDDYANQHSLVNELTSRFHAVVSSSQEPDVPPDLPNQKDLLLAECTTRLLFSALADADWLDTERHFSPTISQARTNSTLDCERLLTILDSNYSTFPKDGLINQLRTKARMEVAELARDETGFFTLQLPTGLGKTLTSVYWALMHARHHGLRRIIVVLPYINIIDQTARILKELFGEDTVLEHHSGIIDDEKERDRYSEDAVGVDNDLAKRLACENWDSPIIVTTTVQFFESLFSNRPFRSRKNHNIARSVVIFDEVQTLPKEYAEPIVVMLKNLHALTNSSFLFCTATQPAFTKRKGFDGIEEIRPLIKKPQRYFNVTRRVNYTLLNHLDEISLDQLMRSIAEERDSLLIVVNTKPVARDLFQRIASFGNHERYYHLSTAMCPHHRKTRIAEVVHDLETRKRIAVVSTQLVEAGVDFDFPCVYRAIGPLDSVIQAAGRCNRNGLLPAKGRVVLFNLEQQKMPDKTYQACAILAKGLIQDDPVLLHRPESFKRYFEQVLRLFVNADKYTITDERRRFNFKNVAESFRMIDEPTSSLLIKDYSTESRLLADELANQLEYRKMSKDEYRKAQQFSVQVYPKFLKEYAAEIEIVKDMLRIWHGNYDNETGLAPQDVETVF
jgi:CRISPR-associated endonuclease/helicase Cas3